MRRFFLMFLFIVLIGCQPVTQVIYRNGSFIANGPQQFVDTQIFPIPGISYNIGNGESGNTPAVDHAQGIFYKENAYSYDNIIHTLDLGYLTGGQQALVFLEVRVIDHGYDYYRDKYNDEAGTIYIRGKNNESFWNIVTPRFQEYTDNILILTNDEGQIEWYHDHLWPYLYNPQVDPENWIFEWEKIVITAKWLVTGTSVE